MMDIKEIIEIIEFEPIYAYDGIGGYEFWGFTGYDKGQRYIEDLTWDESKWSDEENEAIKEYLYDHFDEVVQLYR